MADADDITSETWWQREIVTPELQWLGDELCRRTGQPATAAGDKGNTAHLRGSHRSQEWIANSVFCTNRTYTVQSGLTATQKRHVAGFDFTPGSPAQMLAQCKRLDAALRAGLLEEVREFYGNVDGDQVVDGWNNLENRAASSDSSHLWHWHLGLDRRQMANRALMERIVAIVMGDVMADSPQLTTTNWRVHGLAQLLDTVDNHVNNKAEPLPLSKAVKRIDAQTAANGAALSVLADRLTALEQRPPVVPAPVDPAVVKAALLDPEVLAAVAKAVADEDHARSAG